MSYLAYLALRKGSHSHTTKPGGGTITDLAYPVPGYSSTAEIPTEQFGKVGGVLYWNNDGTIEPLIPWSQLFFVYFPSGVGSPEGAITGLLDGMVYKELAADESKIVTEWIFKGTIGTNTGWITYA